MHLSKLRKLAWVFFALALTTTTVYSQGWRNGNRNFQNQNGNCLSYISDLTEKQRKQITEMEEKHQKEMVELRNKQRSTFNAIEKNEIRGEMLKKVEAHGNSVKNVLNEDQQKQYDKLHTSGFYSRGQNFASRNGNGNFQDRGRVCNKQGFARGNRGNFGNGNFRAGYGNRNFQGNRGNFARVYGNANRGNFGNDYGNSKRRFYWQNNTTETSDVGNGK